MDRRHWIVLGAALLLGSGPAFAAGKSRAAGPSAPAAANTPRAALNEIPALPKAASKDLDCSVKETFEARIQQKLMADSAAIQNSAAQPMAPQSISDAQGQAMQALNDPEFYGCITDLQQRPPELWIDAQREKLDAKLAAIDDAKSRSDAAYCAKHPHGEGCYDDPGSAKRFNAQAVAAATQFLKDAQPPYADYLNDIAACVGKRDAIIATARGAGIGGPMDAMLMSGTQQDWTMVGVAAGAHSAVCMAAKDAAARYLEAPQ